jgi:D-beta-D-heptose 7-phosphate kinase/D-beta-D-heptose 1-phosphate adenosyltransferase
MQLPNFSQARVLVVGDLMLDRYWHGATSRISPEAPVPIVHVNFDEQRAGGAGNVALNIAALGTNVALLGFTGEDEAAISLKNLLDQAGVACLFQVAYGLPTITKLRVLSRNQQLIRLDFEGGFHQIEPSLLLQQFQTELPQSQVVVLSDYGKGTLSQVQAFIRLARELNKPVLVDPKGNDFSIYKQATLITPNFSEFEAIVGHCVDQQQIVERGLNLLRELELQAMLVTRGEHGMTLLTNHAEPLHLPTHAREVFDVTGAGDTVISVLAASLAANLPLPEAVQLANMGAGVVVGKIGTATVKPEELRSVLQGSRAHHKGVCEFSELLIECQAAQQAGEKVVATNGCFDILHPGHIRYLQQAKALGQRLVVLVNSDASVQRLKGPQRPVNGLLHRMEMLAALECVDWVAAFEADTPKEAIDQLLPDILVKGGDYNDITSIAGHESVLAHGGEVKILSFVEGHSTTAIIQTIKDKTQV